MNRYVLTTLALISTAASAQQTIKATFTPVTIDGKTTQNGIVTINGKNYIAADALSSAKVTFLQPNSLGIYNFSAKANIPVKLSGCMNEWLTDGVTRVRATDFHISDISRSDWVIGFDVMTSKDSDTTSNVFAPGQQEVTLKSGQVIAPAKDAFSEIRMTDDKFARGDIHRNIVSFTIPNISDANPPAKLLMTPTAKALVKAPWVFDLTCKK